MDERFYPKEERLYYLAFSNAPKIGPKTFKGLVKYFGTAEKIWHGSLEEFNEAGYTENLFIAFTKFKENFNVEEYLKKLKLAKVEFVSQIDKDYPKRLLTIDSSPIVLYTKGNKSCLNAKKTIGIVGTRKMTSYGEEVTEKLAGELSDFGFTIISGMALGVDATAHKSTLNNKGATIAVLGNGVDLPFPRENENLYNEIVDKGSLIISEYPLGESPSRGTFPARNRIVAALSDGVLVTEAGEESGSLITANIALELNKSVFAVPGPITSSLSYGTSRLLKNGAKIVTQVEDILSNLGFNADKLKKKKRDLDEFSNDEKNIILQLEKENMDIDELLKKTGIKSQDLVVILSGLEIKNIVRNSRGVFSLV